jgi:hypothetical protein
MVNRHIAFDESVRSIDESGHLRIAKTVISKAQVDPYFGREIPGFDAMGLEPDRIYQMLRDPSELEKSADTAKGKQILFKHVYVDSKTPEKELTVGAIGSDVTYEDGKLYADLTFWDDEAISLIDSEKMEQLSYSYYFDPVMTPGDFEGVAFDGVMRNIHGNHLALVERGRIGRDAVISDSLPLEMRLNMKLKKGALALITARLRATAQDGVTPELEKALRAIVGDAEMDKVAGELGADEAPEDLAAKDEDPKPPETADDEDEGKKADAERKRLEEEDKDDKDAKRDDKRATAADADSIAAAVGARLEGKYAARDAVEPLIGRIAMDGFTDAKSIYAYALKQKGIACDGINEAGLKALVTMQRDTKPAQRDVVHDSAPTDYTRRFKQA